ncbi:MAG TPA: hypothetical protein ENI15_09140, partial [Spirochaetes bacterium]|nr:hypothetical protein [Spirochaetota bacterium]
MLTSACGSGKWLTGEKRGIFLMPNNNKLRLTVLSEEQIKSIHEATVDVLENTGVIVDTPEAVDLL